jgi:hypothetical protein
MNAGFPGVTTQCSELFNLAFSGLASCWQTRVSVEYGTKEGKMIDIAFKNLWARKTRSLLTMLGVAVCIMLYLFMAGTAAMVEGNLEKEMAKYVGQIYVKSPAVSIRQAG